MALGVDSAPSENEYQEYPGGKGGRCVRLTTYHHTVPLSRNLGALTILDPSGPAGLLRECFIFILIPTFGPTCIMDRQIHFYKHVHSHFLILHQHVTVRVNKYAFFFITLHVKLTFFNG